MGSLVRFFVAAPPVSPMLAATFAVIVLVAATVLAMEPSRGQTVVLPVLVLQLFAAASGFGGPARRGYYDLLLTSGAGRGRVAVAHWLASVAPGVCSWFAVAALERVLIGSRGAVLASGTCAAMFLLSTLPWALSVNLPRFSASVGWLLVAVMGATLVPGPDLQRWDGALSGSGAIPASAAILVYPVAIVGHDLRLSDLPIVAPALVVGAAALGAACWWIARADFPLEASQ